MSEDNRLSDLYRQTRTQGPPPGLDEAVLTASREAVKESKTAAGPFSGRWPAVASVAAIIVAAILLIPMVNIEQEKQDVGMQAMDYAMPAAEPESTELQAVTDRKQQSAQRSAPASPQLMMKQEAGMAEKRAIPAISPAGTQADRSGAAGFGALQKEDMPFPAAVSTSSDEKDADNSENPQKAAADSSPFAILTPEMWQEKIYRLVVQGKTGAAAIELDRLRKNYPEFNINPELLERLQPHVQP